MAGNIIKFQPYVSYEVLFMFERTREVAGMSLGKVLLALLNESPTFVKLMDLYDDGSDKEINDLLIDLQSNLKFGNNKKKKEKNDINLSSSRDN